MRISSKLELKKVSKACLLFISVMVVTGCINNPEFGALEHKPVTQTGSNKGSNDVYVVQPGDTLYSIALSYDLDHRRLAAANDIDKNYLIYPGQKLLLDVTNVPFSSGGNSSVTSSSTTSVVPNENTQKSTNGQNNDTRGSSAVSGAMPKIRWVWPYNGKIVRTFKSDQSLSKGVDIAGRFGEPVQAAADGKVVFAGSGLRGYGNLIIIEHNPEFLSAYAHASKILVQEQQIVKAGQQIAEIGSSGSSNQPVLHFEIRREGKPVNPVRYLPSN